MDSKGNGRDIGDARNCGSLLKSPQGLEAGAPAGTLRVLEEFGRGLVDAVAAQVVEHILDDARIGAALRYGLALLKGLDLLLKALVLFLQVLDRALDVVETLLLLVEHSVVAADRGVDLVDDFLGLADLHFGLFEARLNVCVELRFDLLDAPRQLSHCEHSVGAYDGTNAGKGYRLGHCPAKLQQRSQFAGVAVCPSESGTSAACAGRTGRAVSGGGARTFCERLAKQSSAAAAGSARARCPLRVRTACRSRAGLGLRLMRVQGEARACCAEARRAPTVRVRPLVWSVGFEGSNK